MTESPNEDTEVTNGSGASSPQEEAAEAAPVADAPPSEAEQLAERTADLQRLQAEYLNYKRRVEREREQAKKRGRDDVLDSLLTVLDDLGRADQHGELVGGFKAVADSLRTVVTKHGLEEFGEVGEAFDPAWHEAVSHAGESAEVSVTSVAQVLRTGFRVGDRVLRAATVIVVDPTNDSGVSPTVNDTEEQAE